jgi:methyl-accepting chemotaxis protein
MNKLAEGCIDFNIPNYKSNNEITDMAHAIRIFKNNALTKEKLEQEKAQKNLSDSLERQKKDAQDSLILQELSEVINAFTKGNLNKHINLDNKQGTLLEICKGVNKINDICKTIFSDLNQSLSQMARGNLEVSISNHYEGMFADIVSSLNTTIRNMKTTIFEILSASKKLEEMAIRISKESNNVSQNMMSQASMLEETSTSMKEIRNSVSSNSNFTNKSVEIAKESYDYVQRGTKTVCDTITMMQNIENAAHSISNIVNMIESVSMQTNLLALNAAVEAARAGDLGKGFAVVAGEVRQLAADCSKASEQIRNLIVDTVENIKEGSNLAQKSGNEMNYVSQQIEQLNQIMTEIATTSRQQSISISEITTSIHQMDNITQNNTNSIESSARLSEEILSQVEYLNNILSVFQVKKHKIAAAA